MKNRLLLWVVGALIGLGGLTAQAEDIDLFAGAGATSSALPNVLIVLDNTANWNTPFTNEMNALATVVSSLPANKFRLGLMMFTETGGGNSNVDGAYVRAAIRNLDADYKTKFEALVRSLDVGNDKSNGGKAGLAMLEAYHYFAGLAPRGGNNKNKTDYTGNVSGTSQSNAMYALAANAINAKSGSPYNTPVVDGCGKNYIIYISNGAAQDNNADITAGLSVLTGLGGTTTTIPLSPNGSQTNPSDEWARFMSQSALDITTYTLDINKVTTGQGPGWSALLKSMATVSGGKPFDVSSTGTEILDALNSVFTEIQAVNSVFASVSLPVSVNTQGTYLNQVFVGQFRPDGDGAPRWNGNLKQYKLGYVTGTTLGLLDANDSSAINNQTGFITECARSFWTPTTTDTYWTFKPSGDCLTVTNAANSNYPDGNIVEKGAQAYRLRNMASRTIKTCSPTFASCTTTLTDFNDGNTAITQSLLGATSTTDRTSLINWARGVDVNYTYDNDGDGTADLTAGDEDIDANITEVRPSVHGDVVHSRPVAINFGTDASPQVVVFYGANDGMLRAVNGNRSANIGTAAPGDELWAFMPPEFYSSIKRIRDNFIKVSYPGATSASTFTTPKPKPYGVDGPVTAYQGGGATWLYAGMRRGGRVLYSFNVSTPATPALKWKVGCPNLANDTNCTTGFEQLGQTWSPAVPMKSAGFGSGASPMLIMGGGYDSCEDTDTADTGVCASPKGNRIYVMNADTGALLTTLTTDRGVVGEITLAKDDNGLALYAYATDLGGNVYRVNIGTDAPASWTITKVASLGCATTATCAPRRKFLFGVDLVQESGVNILLVGSGDREKPLESFSNAMNVSNYFFMIQDKPTEAAWLTTASGACTGDVICLDALVPISGSTTPTTAALAAKKGWYLSMAAKEQIVTASVTVFGTVTFSTSQPPTYSANSCSSNLGTARVYNVAYTDAGSKNGTTSRSETLPAGGLSPSPVAGKVTLDNGETVIFVIGASPTSALEAKKPTPPTAAPPRPTKRVYWNIQK